MMDLARLFRIAARVAAGAAPEFKLQLRDKGQGGRDFGHLVQEKDGSWTWHRVDPSGVNAGFSRRFLTPKEVLRDLKNYTTMDKDAQEAIAYFEGLVKQEAPTTASSRLRAIALRPTRIQPR
jgi:hypothetical protein